MNTKDSIRQFILDGLLGAVTTILLFLMINLVTGSSAASALDLFPHLTLIMISTSFLATGLGALLLTNVSSRASWLISLFGVALISWLVVMGSIIAHLALYTSYRDYELYRLPTYTAASAFGAGMGFVIAGLVAVIFQPTSRYARVFLSGMISAFTGAIFVLLYVSIALIPT